MCSVISIVGPQTPYPLPITSCNLCGFRLTNCRSFWESSTVFWQNPSSEVFSKPVSARVHIMKPCDTPNLIPLIWKWLQQNQQTQGKNNNTMHLWLVAGNIHQESWKSRRWCWPPEHIHRMHTTSAGPYDSFWWHKWNLKINLKIGLIWRNLKFALSPGWIMCSYAAGVESGNASPSHGNPSRLYKSCSATNTFLNRGALGRRSKTSDKGKHCESLESLDQIWCQCSSTKCRSSWELPAGKDLHEVLLQTLIGQVDAKLLEGIACCPISFQGTMKTVKNCSYYQPIKQFHQDHPGQTMLPDGPAELNHGCKPGTLQTFEAINIEDANLVPLIILFISSCFRHLFIFCKCSKLWKPLANIVFPFAYRNLRDFWGGQTTGTESPHQVPGATHQMNLGNEQRPCATDGPFIVVVRRCGHPFEDWRIKSDGY